MKRIVLLLQLIPMLSFGQEDRKISYVTDSIHEFNIVGNKYNGYESNDSIIKSYVFAASFPIIQINFTNNPSIQVAEGDSIRNFKIINVEKMDSKYNGSKYFTESIYIQRIWDGKYQTIFFIPDDSKFIGRLYFTHFAN